MANTRKIITGITEDVRYNNIIFLILLTKNGKYNIFNL